MGQRDKAHTRVIDLHRLPGRLGRSPSKPVEPFTREQIADREALYVVFLFHALLLFVGGCLLFPIPHTETAGVEILDKFLTAKLFGSAAASQWFL